MPPSPNSPHPDHNPANRAAWSPAKRHGSLELPPNAARPSYRRIDDLPRLISIWPHELDATDRTQREAIVARLRAALRAERRRGLAGHWTYDLARHSQLLAAYRAEAAALAQMPTSNPTIEKADFQRDARRGDSTRR